MLRRVLVCAMSSLLGAASPCPGASLCDGTNVWVGAASGGSWSDVRNWRAESAAGWSVPELFARYAVYDLRGLSPGAVVTFDYAGGNVYNVQNTTGQMFLAGLVAAGSPGDVWTVAKGTDVKVHFVKDAVLDIAGGRLDFHAATDTGFSYPTMPFVKRGNGAFRLCQPNAFFWETTSTIGDGRFSLTNNANLLNAAFRLTGPACLSADFGTNRIAGVSSDTAGAPVLEVSDRAVLDLMGGFNQNARIFHGNLAGTGELRISGGVAYSFLRGVRRGPLSFGGLLSIGAGDLVLGAADAPLGVNAAVSVAIGAGGWLRFSTSQRLAGLSGAGVDGGIAWPDAKTLTIDATSDATYAGRLAGGVFVKDGPGTLVLEGATAPTSVLVRRGVLGLRAAGAASVPAPVAHWDFDAYSESAGRRIFPDQGPAGADLLSVPSNGTRHVAHIAMPYPEDRGSKAVRIDHGTSHLRLAQAGALERLLPKGGSFSVSLRTGRSSTGRFLILGDGTAAGSIVFSYESCPRVMSVYAGSSSRIDFGGGSLAYADYGATWFLHTLVYDAAARELRLYEDGVLRKKVANRMVALNALDLLFGAGTLSDGVASGYVRNAVLDDLRLWNVALTDGEVQTLARTFRFDTSARPPVLPTDLVPQVDAGACLRIAAGRHVLPSVRGSGAVEIGDGAELALTDSAPPADAMRTFDGAGTLDLPEGVSFARDGDGIPVRPVWSHAGTVKLPSRGHVAFTRVSAAEPPDTGLYPLVSAPTFVEPAGWDGWTVEPVLTNRTVTFEVVGGTFCARVTAPDRVSSAAGARLAVESLGGDFYLNVFLPGWGSKKNGTGNAVPAAGEACPFTVDLGDGTSFAGLFTFSQTGDRALSASWTFTPSADISVSALAVSIELPIAQFASGWAVADERTVPFPVEAPAKSGLFDGRIGMLALHDATGRLRARLAFPQPHQVLLQDGREWDGTAYTVRIRPTGGSSFTAGVPVTVAVDLTLPEPYDFAPVPEWTARAGLRWIPMPRFAYVKAGSALDLSSFRGTNAPAGCHGRVVRRGAHFEFEERPGVPQRFYGVNICQEANAPSGNEAVFAANLARMGYNAIRFHHHEAALVKDTGDAGATKLNAAAMDRFDRLAAACVTNGIYITTDLFVSRSPISWKSLGIDRSGALAAADFKALVLVHEPAVSNLVEFTRNWLGHINPYLGRSLAQEPALIGISLVNEGAISTVPSTLAATYPVWKTAWENWLAAKKRAEPEVYGNVPVAVPSAWTPFFRHFVQEREHALAARLRSVVRNELGCPVPLTSLNGTTYPLAYMEVRAAEYDYADDHFYVDHPSFPETKWALPSTLGNKNPLVGTNRGMPSPAFRRLFDRPYTVTEFNFSAPGRYRGVGGLATGAAAALQDWDGVWRFAWTHGEGGIVTPEKKALSYFDVAGDPLAQAAERAAICLFLRRDLPVLSKGLVARVPSACVTGPTDDLSTGADCSWRWAGWHARLGHIVGDAVPAGLTEVGTYPSVRNLTDGQVRSALGYGNSLPAGGEGALDIAPATGAFRLDTPRTCGGFAESGSVVAGPLAFDLSSTPTTLWVSSLDARPVTTSARLLLTHLTDVQNTDILYMDASRTYLKKWGRLPHLMRAGRAEVRLALEPGRFTVYALAPDGSRARTVDSAFAPGEGLVFTADTAAVAEATWLYEIVRRPPVPCILLR